MVWLIIVWCNNRKKHLAVKLLWNNYIANIVELLKTIPEIPTKPWPSPAIYPSIKYTTLSTPPPTWKTSPSINSKTPKPSPSSKNSCKPKNLPSPKKIPISSFLMICPIPPVHHPHPPYLWAQHKPRYFTKS